MGKREQAKAAAARRAATQNGNRRRFKDEIPDDLAFERQVREDGAHFDHYSKTGEWLSPRPFPTWRK